MRRKDQNGNCQQQREAPFSEEEKWQTAVNIKGWVIFEARQGTNITKKDKKKVNRKRGFLCISQERRWGRTPAASIQADTSRRRNLSLPIPLCPTKHFKKWTKRDPILSKKGTKKGPNFWHLKVPPAAGTINLLEHKCKIEASQWNQSKTASEIECRASKKFTHLILSSSATVAANNATATAAASEASAKDELEGKARSLQIESPSARNRANEIHVTSLTKSNVAKSSGLTRIDQPSFEF